MAEKKSQSAGGLKPSANRLAGKICVVLGGTGNVGAGIAQAFAEEGATKVVVTSRSQEKIDSTRAQWGWPASVVGIVGNFGDDEGAETTVASVWEEAGGAVDHCVVSLGFGGVTAPFSEDSADSLKTFLTTHQWPRLRAAIQVSKRMLEADIPGSTLTMPSGALADGIHKFPFPGFSSAWANGVGGALYKQMCYSIACEAKEKGKQLRAHAVVIYPGVSKHGEDKQQMGMPAEPDSSVHLGQGWVAVVLDTAKANGESYQFGSFQNFDFTDMDEFVAKVFEQSTQNSASATDNLVVAVQNCGNAGLYAIKTLLAKGGCTVRTCSRNPEKLKAGKLAGMDNVQVFKTGDQDFYKGVNRFIVIPPGAVDPDDRAKSAIEFANKCKDAGATHGALVSVVVAPKGSRRRGLFGAQFGEVEDVLSGFASEGVTLCTVRAPFFLDNMWGDVDSIKSHDTFYAPVGGDVRQLATSVADVGEAVAMGALDASAHGGKAYFVLGDHITKNEVAALYSAKLGRPINFVQASVEAATAAMKGFGFVQWQIDGILELNGLNDSADFVAQHAGEFKQLTGRNPVNTSQFLDSTLIPAIAPPARLDLVSVYNQIMYCWEHGLEEEYKALVVPDLVLDIPAFNSTTTGVDAIWGFRQYVATQMAGVGGNDPLSWINTHSTHKINGNQVNAYMKSYHLATGNLEQLGEWSVDFNEHGLVTKMTQRVLWRGDGNAGPPGGEAAALSMEPSTDNLVSAYNGVMFAWEQGREDAYRALTADGIKMTIPAFGQEVEGQDAIWKFREYVATKMAQIDANAPLPWINTHDTFSVDPSTNTVVAYMKSFTVGAAGEAGKLVQLGEWVVTFDDSGKCTAMLQKVLWRGDGNAGPAGGGPTPICSDPSSGGDLVSKYNAVMLAWSSGNEAAYKKLTSDQIHMTIPAFQSDTTGHDAIWGFRQYVATNFGGVGGNDKLPWINTHDTFVVHDDHVDAYMKSFSTIDGSLQQVGRWTVSFGDDGKCESMHQDVLWRKPAPGGDGEGESKGESEGEAPVRIRQPSVLTGQHPARSCRITSHTTTKSIRYSFEIKGIASPWSPKEGATEIGGGIVVERRFREFQAVHRTMARQAKANGDIAAPPRMPDGGGAVMWFRRHSAKTIERRETRFNEILEYMIKTPVINEHEAVIEFLGLNFAPPAE